MSNDRESILSRMFVAFGLVLLLPAGIVFQLVRVQFFEGDELRALWSEQAIDYITIPARRGDIYDETGSLLATSAVRYKLAFDPHPNPQKDRISNQKIHELCKTLSKFTHRRARYYQKKIKMAPNGSRYIVLATDLDTDAYDALNDLDNKGIILQEHYDRKYNFGTLAAHVLGFVNHNTNGMIGLEAYYNEDLKGDDGLQQVRRDGKGRIHSYIGAPRKKPEQGYSLYTTIDSHIQAITEEELKDGVQRTRAKHGTAIVMDPRTGAIKALANYPTFNPNYPARSDDENRRNYAIADMIEPGSTFKIVTAIAALEQGKVHFGEKFKTPDNGRKMIYGQWMRDHDPMGTLTFEQVIEKSSNIATSQIAMRLKPKVFYQYARNLGFGNSTNIDLPNEEPGKLRKPYEWSKVTLPWMSIGYEVQVTPIQLAQAYAAFANHGKMMRPYLVDRIVDEEGDVVNKHNPIEVRQIADRETLEKLLPVFEKVVSDSGTAKWAKVKGLPVAGKTGTAQKYEDGRYHFAYRASFVGFFPAENPKYVCLVILDEPHTSIYGGYTAGPIFKHVAKRIAGLDNDIQKEYWKHQIPDTVWAYTPLLRGLSRKEATSLLENQQLNYDFKGRGNWIVAQKPDAGTQLDPRQEITLKLSNSTATVDSVNTPKGYANIPDVVGLSMRKASLLINNEGYQTQIIGSGTVYAQYPKPGSRMKKGQTVTIRGKGQSLETLTASRTASK